MDDESEPNTSKSKQVFEAQLFIIKAQVFIFFSDFKAQWLCFQTQLFDARKSKSRPWGPFSTRQTCSWRQRKLQSSLYVEKCAFQCSLGVLQGFLDDLLHCNRKDTIHLCPQSGSAFLLLGLWPFHLETCCGRSWSPDMTWFMTLVSNGGWYSENRCSSRRVGRAFSWSLGNFSTECACGTGLGFRVTETIPCCQMFWWPLLALRLWHPDSPSSYEIRKALFRQPADIQLAQIQVERTFESDRKGQYVDSNFSGSRHVHIRICPRTLKTQSSNNSISLFCSWPCFLARAKTPVVDMV